MSRMEFNPANFVQIEKRTKRSAPAVELRVSAHNVRISPALFESFSNDPKRLKLTLAFQYSEKDKALLLSKPEDKLEGFDFSRSGRDKFAYVSSTPVHMKLLGVPKGIYKPLPDRPDIFVLQPVLQNTSRMSKYFEEEEAQVGDIVSWFYVPKGAPRRIATGVVLELATNKSDDPVAVIRPISKHWFEDHPHRAHRTQIVISNLIVKEKRNG